MYFIVYLQVLWTVDPCEDNNRMKPKLGKNSHGTQYLRDFLLANAAISENMPLVPGNAKAPSPTPAPVRNLENEELSKGRALGEELQAEDSGGDSMTR